MAKYHHGNLREALLNLAMTRIAEGGVESLSMRQLAKDAGVSHAAPMRHFKSKDELLSALVATFYHRLTAHITECVELEPDLAGEAVLTAMARAALEWTRTHPTECSVMINPDVNRFADKDLRRSLAEFLGLVFERSLTAMGIEQGENADLDSAVIYMVGAVIGISFIQTNPLLQDMFPNAEADHDAMAEHIGSSVRKFIAPGGR